LIHFYKRSWEKYYIMVLSEFKMGADEFYVTREVQSSFERHGFILVRGLLDKEEVSKLRQCMEESKDIPKFAIGRSDGQGATSKLCVWNKAGDDVCGVVARSRKVAGTLEQLLGGEEIYHYHSKLMMKEAHTGGAHLWHQDYGYWYQNRCMTPAMGSVFMPVDKCTRNNSCLQVLAGSHSLGRVDHYLMGDQSGADPTRVELARQMFEHVYVEMDPGDALFFHSNLLHTSDQNKSDMRRWVMISSFNQARNSPDKEHHHPLYHPLNMLPNSAIRECSKMDSTIDKDFMDPAKDKSAKSLKKFPTSA